MAIAHDPYEVAPPVEHGWATTALHSMLSKEASSEELKAVWTTAALVLKGYDAVPVELKILLDRLFATYHDSIRLERRHRLAYLGWSEEEYERGYKIVVSQGAACVVPSSGRGPVSHSLEQGGELSSNYHGQGGSPSPDTSQVALPGYLRGVAGQLSSDQGGRDSLARLLVILI